MSSSSQMLSLPSLIEFPLPLRDMKTSKIFLRNPRLPICSHKIIAVESRENRWMKGRPTLNIHHSEARKVIYDPLLTFMNKEWSSKRLASLDLTKFNLVQDQALLHNLISITSIPLLRQYQKTFRLKKRDLKFNRDQLQAAIRLGSITYLLILEMRRIDRKSTRTESQQEDFTTLRPTQFPTIEIILSIQSLKLLMVTRKTRPKVIKR